jgi:hypothetical protein
MTSSVAARLAGTGTGTGGGEAGQRTSAAIVSSRARALVGRRAFVGPRAHTGHGPQFAPGTAPGPVGSVHPRYLGRRAEPPPEP